MALEAQEQGNLIGSDKVEGTAVYGADRNKIGSIERVMIDKSSGKVSYAVLSFGGFLGIGDDHYPLPWQSLKYDTSLGGYLTGVTETQLKGAPKYGNDNAWNWADPTRTRAVNDYYGVAICPRVAIRHRKARHHGGPFLSIRRPLPAGPIVGRDQRKGASDGKILFVHYSLKYRHPAGDERVHHQSLIPSCLRTAAALLPTLSIAF